MSSSLVLRSVDVKEACEKAIASIKASRDRTFEEAIAEARRPKWYHRAFHFDPPSREQAIRDLKSTDHFISEYDFIMSYAGYQEVACERLVAAAERTIKDDLGPGAPTLIVSLKDFEEFRTFMP